MVGEDESRQKPFDLMRFVRAQESVYGSALAELHNGRKRTHWMWFVFPQIDGLGHSDLARRYALAGLEEAKAYLAHPVLGRRLRECAQAALGISGRSASEIFGYPDDRKLQSSMTLFALAAGEGSEFSLVLDKYFHGRADARTLALLEERAED